MATDVKQKQSRFFQKLFTEHHLPLVKFLTRKVADPHEAEDIAQSAYQKMMSIPDPEKLDNSKGYLYQVAHNLAIDRIRKRQSHTKFLQVSRSDDIELENQSPSPEREVAAREQLDKVHQLIDELPPNCRKAFLLNRGQHLSYQAISDELGVSVSSVEKYIMQALVHLRKKL